MGQSEHPHPQEDFPFFLLRIMPAMMAATTAISTAHIMMVAIFSEIHAKALKSLSAMIYSDVFFVKLSAGCQQVCSTLKTNRTYVILTLRIKSAFIKKISLL